MVVVTKKYSSVEIWVRLRIIPERNRCPAIDDEIHTIITDAYDKTVNILKTHIDKLHQGCSVPN